MKPSHLHVAFKDPAAATEWFKQILEAVPVHENPKMTVFRFGDLDLVIDQDWGEGDTSMTFALKSDDCRKDYERLIRNGAKPRTPPRDKGEAIGADVFGPGKLIIELEQTK